ncbi:hypothetical protein N7519_008184 [Penicillium mononematosum]|uniref:uncharacterized protein n=1 Tax=Penicillium mononematosum TaxID=268346 RepID=UPI002548C7EA|nr:uncharacterized protein N7519_008184 [Penicillium mononematosum]KAJ6177723.1 hypothetical protein N7519_008184 [Penicillium mononematosum]
MPSFHLLAVRPESKNERPTLHRRPIKSQSHLELELIKCNLRSLSILMGIRMARNESSFVNCLTEISPVTAHPRVRIPLGFASLPPTIVTDGANEVAGFLKRSLLSRLIEAG